MFRTDDFEIPTFSEMVDLDLASVVPSVAGPKRPQDRVALPRVWESSCNVWEQPPNGGTNGAVAEAVSREEDEGGIDPDGMAEATSPNGPPNSRAGPGWIGRDRGDHVLHDTSNPPSWSPRGSWHATPSPAVSCLRTT